MLTFRAVNDFKGIRKGQVWELLSTYDISYTDVPIMCKWERKKYIMVRQIGDILTTIFLVRSELEENFEWINKNK